MTFSTKLTNLLKTDPRLVNDVGDLLVAALQDRAWKLDHAVVNLLLSDPEIEGDWIFNTNTVLSIFIKRTF